MKNIVIKVLLPAFLLASAAISAPREAPTSGVEQKTPLPTRAPNLNIMKVAHRGVKALAPENTLPAIKKAIDMGYDYVEMDVRYSRDGVPVLFHDYRLSRKTNGFGTVSLFKLASLKKLDAGARFGDEYRGTRIPTLEECLELMQGRINLYLDQKNSPKPELFRLLKKYGFHRGNTVVVGFLKPYQRKLLKHYPDAPVMPWLGNAADVEKVLKKWPTTRAFNTSCRQLTPEMVTGAHKHGVMVFTNVLGVRGSKERDCMRRTIECGADAIQFDHPEILLPLLEEMKKETAEGIP